MDTIAELLPSFCPFSDFVNYLNNATSIMGNFLRTFNWFVPIADMIVILQVWAAAIGVWYAAKVFLRKLDVIQ
jgi:hypothetical protein